jgi:hypothetical protein
MTISREIISTMALPMGCLASSLLSCEERIFQPVVVSLQEEDAGHEPNGAASCRTVPPPICEGRCCPTAAECYPFANPSPYSGAECLAQRDNTEQDRWQFRQTLSVSQKPAGLVAPGIPAVLARRSELPSSACGAPTGTSGFIQLIDFDRDLDTSRVGFAKFETDLLTAASSGLCFVEETSYTNPTYALPELYVPDGWPAGLPPPMPMPWNVVSVTAARVPQDFDLARDRAEILARFAPGGALDGKANGIFYLDETTGYMHGYSPVTYIVNYDTASQYIVVPIRESEIKQWLNDPKHPNCAGVLLGDNPALPDSCVGDGTNRAWGCPEGTCAPDEFASTRVDGYFLLAELEQVFTLGQTLCSLFAGSGGYPDWTIPADARNCRGDPKWNPREPVTGLPRGDWCSTTNGPADDGCHDALQSISYATFQAFPIRDGSCSAL